MKNASLVNRTTVLPIALGLAGSAGTLLAVPIRAENAIIISIQFSLILPALAAIAFGKRGAFLAFLPGGLFLYPFLQYGHSLPIAAAVTAINAAWLLIHSRETWYDGPKSGIVVNNRFIGDFLFEISSGILIFGVLALVGTNPSSILSPALELGFSTGVSRFVAILVARCLFEISSIRRLGGFTVGKDAKARDSAMAWSFLAGASIWFLDAVIDILLFSGGKPFLDILILDPSSHDIVMRSLIVMVSLALGMYASKLIAKNTKANDALAKSELIWNTLVEHLPQAICFKDADSRYISINSKFAELIRSSPEHIAGSTDFAWFPADVAERQVAEGQAAMASGVPSEITEERSAGGKSVILRTLRIPVRNEAEGVSGLFSVSEDITEKTLAENELRRYRSSLETMVRERSSSLEESGRRLKALLDSITESAFLMTGEGTILAANRTVAQRLGRNEDEAMIGKNVFDLMDPETAAGRIAWLRLARDEGREVRFTDRRGNVVMDSVITPVPAASGAPLEFAVFGRDITEEQLSRTYLEIQKETALELIHTANLGEGSDLLLRRILAIGYFSSGVVFFQDQNTRFLKLTSSHGISGDFMTRFSVITPDSVIAEKLVKAGTVWKRAEDLLAGKEAVMKEGIRFLAIVPISFKGSPIALFGFGSKEADAPPESMRVFLETIAAQTAELFSRILAEEVSRDKTKELETFAYAASHDLREPLRTVRSFAELLSARYLPVLDDKGKDYLSRIRNGSDRMEDMLQGILDYSRVTTRGERFVRADADHILDEALESLVKYVEETGTVVERAPLPQIICDPIQIERVFINLIGNAIKYVRPGELPRIRVSCRERADAVQFDIDDNGIGIPGEFSEQIFRIFQRLHPRSKYPGTGLGLALARRIVERHGGAIWVTGNELGGSRFSFTVSRRRATSEREPGND